MLNVGWGFYGKILKLLFPSIISFIFLSCNLNSEVNGGRIAGNVVRIVDGDTYDIIVDGKQTRIRMFGIDAPERGMDYYKVSKQYLGELCMNQGIHLEIVNTDRYGRIVAKSFLADGRELGAEMIRAGMAWHFKRYSDDEVLATLETTARENQVGLWSISNPIPPWDYRARKKSK
jgi:endonuclease YncB( thermonuclease family)